MPYDQDKESIDIAYVFSDNQKGYWDHSMILHILTDRIGIPKSVNIHELNWDTFIEFGCNFEYLNVFIVGAGFKRSKLDAMLESLDKSNNLHAVNFWILSDEEWASDAIGSYSKLANYRKCVNLFTQYSHSDDCANYPIPIGPTNRVYDIRYSVLSPGLYNERTTTLTFIGQVNNAERAKCVDAVKKIRNSCVINSYEFSRGLDFDLYYEQMRRSLFVACPAGTHSVDSFRLYEAIHAGALPIVSAEADNNKLFEFGDFYSPNVISPLPIAHNWNEVNNLITMPEEEWNLRAAKCAVWLKSIMLELAEDFIFTLRPSKQLTIVMPTSIIPSHPSIQCIGETIERLMAYQYLQDARILVTADGIRPEQNSPENRLRYSQYLYILSNESLNRKLFQNVEMLIFPNFMHQAAMMYRAVSRVNTKYLMYVEHDTYPIGHIPWKEILNVMDSEDIEYVRFHIFDRILDEHNNLYFPEQEKRYEHFGLIPTIQWSQRPHIASLKMYYKILAKYFDIRDRTMIEDKIHGVAQTPSFEHKLYVFNPHKDVTMLRSHTSDGRKGDPKFDMIYYEGQK